MKVDASSKSEARSPRRDHNQREIKQVRKSPRRLGNIKTTTQQEEKMSYQVKDGWQQSLT